MSDATVYVIAPPSLASWFTHFIDPAPGDSHRFVGEGAVVDVDPILDLLDDNSGATAVIISSHDSLLRDLDLADKMRAAGHDVVIQSEKATILGTDKIAMKQFFDRQGFPTAPWCYGREGTFRPSAEDVVVVKGRNSTQSQGIRLATGNVDSPHSFVELYSDGIEYSLLAHRLAGRCVTFPAVWKGPTSPLLTPPWKRLRLCPAPGVSWQLAERMRELTILIAESADVCGYLEVEFLVTPDGRVLILEINPRVSGTLRIAAMATDIPVFSLHRPRTHHTFPALAYAAELPYQGPSFNAPRERVFATSRLTVAADAPAGVTAALARYEVDVTALLPDPWTAVSSSVTGLPRKESAI